MPEPKVDQAPSRVFRCSFCLKPQTEVAKLVAGPGVFICDACVGLCVDVMASEPATKVPPTAIVTPEKMPTESLLALLGGHNRAFESVDAAMQDIVGILRDRQVSWAAVGETLGVSRQAAWKRFG